jgi:parvulin-like peptidyl-prolyl isomerase
MGLSEKVEDEVNQRLHEVATHQGEETRLTLRTEIMKRTVFEQEVDSPIFFSLSIEELHAYFDLHKDKFRKPEIVTISEIFLSTEGKDEAQVKVKVEQLVAQLHAGADFARLAAANSERDEKGKPLPPTTGGKVGTFEVPMLREDIAAAIRNIKVGGISQPVKTNDGYQILRVDERIPATTGVFNQNRVREAMTIERSPKAHEEYLQRLRNEAFIEIAKSYQASVAPPR